MPSEIHNLFEIKTHGIQNLKIDKDKVQVNYIKLLKLIHRLSYDVLIIILIWIFEKKVEVIKQYRQSVTNI